MGLGDIFRNIKRKPGKALLGATIGGALGGAAFGAGGAAVGAGVGAAKPEIAGSFRDTLFGEESGGGFQDVPTSLQDVLGLGRRAQLTGLTQLLNRPEPTESLARAGAERDIRAQRGATEDAQRQLQSQVAQRGLGQSSIGLSANVDLQRQQSERENLIRASIPERLEALRTQRIQGLVGTGGQALSQTGHVPGVVDPTISGGIAPLLGLAAGGYLGGAEGAKVGLGAGQLAQGQFARRK